MARTAGRRGKMGATAAKRRGWDLSRTFSRISVPVHVDSVDLPTVTCQLAGCFDSLLSRSNIYFLSPDVLHPRTSSPLAPGKRRARFHGANDRDKLPTTPSAAVCSRSAVVFGVLFREGERVLTSSIPDVACLPYLPYP